MNVRLSKSKAIVNDLAFQLKVHAEMSACRVFFRYANYFYLFHKHQKTAWNIKLINVWGYF